MYRYPKSTRSARTVKAYSVDEFIEETGQSQSLGWIATRAKKVDDPTLKSIAEEYLSSKETLIAALKKLGLDTRPFNR